MSRSLFASASHNGCEATWGGDPRTTGARAWSAGDFAATPLGSRPCMTWAQWTQSFQFCSDVTHPRLKPIPNCGRPAQPVLSAVSQRSEPRAGPATAWPSARWLDTARAEHLRPPGPQGRGHRDGPTGRTGTAEPGCQRHPGRVPSVPCTELVSSPFPAKRHRLAAGRRRGAVRCAPSAVRALRHLTSVTTRD